MGGLPWVYESKGAALTSPHPPPQPLNKNNQKKKIMKLHTKRGQSLLDISAILHGIEMGVCFNENGTSKCTSGANYIYIPSKNRPGIPAEFQWNSRSGLDSGRSPPEFRVAEMRNSGFQWIPGSEFWSPADSGIRVLESGGIPGLEFCHVMAFQSRVRSPAEFRVWSSGVRLKIWGPAEFQTLVLLHLSAVITDAWMP